MKRTIFGILAVFAVGVDVPAQSPQGGVKPSYVQCPPEMGPYDPAIEYKSFERKMGTAENPLICREVVDKLPSGAWCQMAFICEQST